MSGQVLFYFCQVCNLFEIGVHLLIGNYRKNHAGREHDADRMQLCCRLIDGATADINPDERALRMLSLLFKILEQDITGWSD